MSKYVLAEWRRATESLGAARVRHGNGFYTDAVSRAYYAILHAAKAALQLHNVTAESHAAVRRLFSQHLVRTGLLEAEWGTAVGQSADLRILSDYDVTRLFDEVDAREACDRADAFLTRIRTLLTSSIPHGRVLVFQVPSRPIGMPIQYQGAYWMRSGEDLVPMTPDMLQRIFAESGPDFSAESCPPARLDELDPVAAEVLRRLWQHKSPGNPFRL